MGGLLIIFHSYFKRVDLPEGITLLVLNPPPFRVGANPILPVAGIGIDYDQKKTFQPWACDSQGLGFLLMLCYVMLPSGNLTQLLNITIFNGTTHKKMAIFNSYVKLPEGMFFQDSPIWEVVHNPSEVP